MDVDAREGWSTRVFWYVGQRHYSRRELAADAIIHLSGVASGCAGCARLCSKAFSPHMPGAMRAALAVYALSVLFAVGCSTVYNCCGWVSRRWAARRVRTLKLLDHAGILLLITGSQSPILVLSGCHRTLAVGWACALVSIGRRLHALLRHGSWREVGLVDLGCFLALGWAPTAVLSDVSPHLDAYFIRMLAAAAVLYRTGGLVPFVWSRLEGHTALWHLCVVGGTACIMAAHLRCLAAPADWTAASRERWRLDEPRWLWCGGDAKDYKEASAWACQCKRHFHWVSSE